MPTLTLDDLLTIFTALTHPIPSILPLFSLLYLHNSTSPQATALTHLFPSLLSPTLLYFTVAFAAISWLVAGLHEIDEWLLGAGPGVEWGGWGVCGALVGWGGGKRGRETGMASRGKGKMGREVQWKEEVVLITGGAGGLGREIVVGCLGRGARVGVVDVVDFEGRAEGEATQNKMAHRGAGGDREEAMAVDVRKRWARWGDGVRGRWRYYRVDVGDAAAVEGLRERVREDLGVPTILINNAGITHSKPLLELSAAEVESSFRINTLSHFHTIRTFLPGMLASERGGTIVTVASVLGYLGCAGLTDYAASKAALIAMHTSLRAELSFLPTPSNSPISMILATPGQLQTPLFSHVPPPLLSNFFGPLVSPKELAKKIIEAVESGKPEVRIAVPAYAGMVQVALALPRGMWRVLKGAAGVDRAGWRGVVEKRRRSGGTD